MPYWHTAHDAWPEVVCLDRGDPRTPLAVGCRLAPMAACPACGFEYEGDFKFCPECAAPLAAPTGLLAEERKVVSVLFCDLVGFTASSEQADPEDVDRMLSAYAEMARARIEAHGGVVEKFIGDAVVGVFGVPAAHEDDPERAVRAGLRIVEGAEELESLGGEPLRLRVGINTGEALVRLGASAGRGERLLSGDAINTASRIQSAAPEMGVAVGLATYEATAPVFDYLELEPETLKGKAEPVRMFQAKAARARYGTDLTRTHHTPFVGREVDLALLKGIFDKTVASSSVQLVTVVGEPGLGKSRLVAELFAYIDARPESTIWRQGRCLPYGEGITFWALGEILKAHTGILESDTHAVAHEKLAAVLPEGEEREWFRQRLLPLFGIEATSTAEREELFTAWRRFLERSPRIARPCSCSRTCTGPTRRSSPSSSTWQTSRRAFPCSSWGLLGPELYERHPRVRGDAAERNARSPSLRSRRGRRPASSPLCWKRLSSPPSLQQPILERAGGNPLYAEEFVRLLKDRDLLVRMGSSWELRGRGGAIPGVGAGTDRRSPRHLGARGEVAPRRCGGDRQGLLGGGAWRQMGERDRESVVSTLRELSRKELVRPYGSRQWRGRRSTPSGTSSPAMSPTASCPAPPGPPGTWQQPGGSSRRRPSGSKTWPTCSPTTTRPPSNSPAPPGKQSRRRRSRHRLFASSRLAGERALGLDTAAALASFERALTLTPAGHPERAAALARFGEAAYHAGRYGEARQALEEAISAFQAAGDVRAAARAMGMLGAVLYRLGDPSWVDVGRGSPGAAGAAAARPRARRARSPNWDGGVPPKVQAGGGVAIPRGRSRSQRSSGCPLGARPRLPRVRPYGVGDRGGIEEMREAIALAVEAGQGREAVVAQTNLAGVIESFEGPRAGLEATQAAIALAQARGIEADFARSTLPWTLFSAGDPEEALALAAAIVDNPEERAVNDLIFPRATQARILTLRGQAAQVAGLARLAGDQLPWNRVAHVHLHRSDCGRRGPDPNSASRTPQPHCWKRQNRCPAARSSPTQPRCALRSQSATANSPSVSPSMPNLAALWTNMGSLRERQLSRRPAATSRPPQWGTRTPPGDGRPSVLFPSRRSPCSGRADASPNSAERAKPARSSSKPARSSRGCRPPPPSQRRTNSCSRRPR